MSQYNPVAFALARALSPTPNPHGPRPPMPVTGIATLQAVDPYSASATVRINGSTIDISGMRYMHAYNDDNQPLVDDEAVLHVSGAGQIFLMGRHVRINALSSALLP